MITLHKQFINEYNNIWLSKVNYDMPTISLINFIAGITKGQLRGEDDKEVNKRLIKRLLVENGGNASRIFEFIPIIGTTNKIDCINYEEFNSYLKFGFIDNNRFRTNLRNNINNKKDISILTNNENITTISDFHIIIGCMPVKAYNHIKTHTQLTTISESSRSSKYKPDFWIPNDISKFQQFVLRFVSKRLYNLSMFLRKIKIKSEIANMFLPDNRIVLVAMAGWKDDNTWNNLFKVRGDKTGTMGITNDIAKNLSKLLI